MSANSPSPSLIEFNRSLAKICRSNNSFGVGSGVRCSMNKISLSKCIKSANRGWYSPIFISFVIIVEISVSTALCDTQISAKANLTIIFGARSILTTKKRKVNKVNQRLYYKRKY